MFRTVLTAALHLCYLSGIKKVVLVGVDMDDRQYFFKNPMFDPKSAYEQRGKRSIKSHFHGYTTHRIVREVIQSLISSGKMEISYLGESQFLSTIPGISKAKSKLPL